MSARSKTPQRERAFAAVEAVSDATTSTFKRKFDDVKVKSMKCKTPRTQRAWGCYDDHDGFSYGQAGRAAQIQKSRRTVVDGNLDTPVLVIPEAAVKRCPHTALCEDDDLQVCRNCGAWRYGLDPWTKPRILRPQRSKT